GVFYSELRFTDGERRVNIDSRTSDAIAIAMRTGAPIYTTSDILHECGFILENDPMPSPSAETVSDDEPTEEQLRQMLDEAIKAENYEEAARINSLIDKKNKRP
ncbi:MAG: bifunctional nuclease family protein, partial [Muribaculaceae bacterium]|nr:bifunctional nuclease family protein [Muribaculaceae bacterium]